MKKITEFVGSAVSSWGPTVSILVTVVLCSYTIFGEMKRIESRLDQQISNSSDMFIALSQRVDDQNKRSDRLYEMFIDLLKEQRR